MPLYVRVADLSVDERTLTDFLARNYVRTPDQHSFRWLYQGNPAGQARVWFCSHSETGALVGVAGAFPRRMCVGRSEELGWVLGDFVIDAQYRSLGPAIQLQRACLEDLNSGAPATYYDFPSTSMMAVYQRLGVRSSISMVRLIKHLRIDDKVSSRIGNSSFAHGLSSVANAGLAWRNAKVRHNSSFCSAIKQNDCGTEFTELAWKLIGTTDVCALRSAEYLNWRYRHHPYRVYEMVTSHRAGSLMGYAVVTQADHILDIVDLFGVPEAISQLLREVIFIAMERRLQGVAAAILANQSWLKPFADLGFHQREKFPVVASSRGESAENGQGGSVWFLMNGDRES